MRPVHEMFHYPAQHRDMARVTAAGELEVLVSIEELERTLATAWDFQERGLARLILEIARLRGREHALEVQHDSAG